MYGVKCLAIDKATLFTNWPAGGIDTDKFILVTTLQDPNFDPDKTYFKTISLPRRQACYTLAICRR